MNFRQLTYFQLLAHNEHLIKTANQIMVTPSSISTSISNLEEELGVQLFDRFGRNMKLNDYGRTFLQQVDTILQAQRNAVTELADLKKTGEMQVSFGMKHPLFWSNLICAFAKEHPGIRLIQRDVEVEMQKNELRRLDVDFLITAIDIESNDWHADVIMADEIVLVVPSNHSLAGRKLVRLEELKDEPFIGCAEGVSFRALLDRICSKAGFSPNYVRECDPTLIPDICSHETAVTLSTWHTCQSGLFKNSVIIRLEDESCRNRPLYIYHHKDRYLTDAAKAFCAHTLSYYEGKEIEKILG